MTSFGYKHGVPRDADLIFDVRFLPNPHWVRELRPLIGTDQPVKEYVLGFADAGEFLTRIEGLLSFLIPRYEEEGKSYLTIGIGCTGGHHRSVVLAEELAAMREDHRSMPMSATGIRSDERPVLRPRGLERSFSIQLVPKCCDCGATVSPSLSKLSSPTLWITAVVAVADDGGSSGRRLGLGIPPPGDIRRCLLALTPDPTILSSCRLSFPGG